MLWYTVTFDDNRCDAMLRKLLLASMSGLTKKQQKAQRFRKGEKKEKQEKAVFDKELQEYSGDENDNIDKDTDDKAKPAKRLADDSDEPPAKKRKTRRGKKGKGVNGGKGPRFILFVGNLPYDITQEQLQKHFKSCKPDRIRIRQDKGIAFMEFDNDTKEIQHKMGLALALHHSTLNNRKINVELTVGGGGNSEARVNKLKEKNDKSREQRKELIQKKTKKEVPEGMHPARAALMQ